MSFNSNFNAKEGKFFQLKTIFRVIFRRKQENEQKQEQKQEIIIKQIKSEPKTANILIIECKSDDFKVCGSALAEIYHRLNQRDERFLHEMLENEILDFLIPRLKMNKNCDVRFDAVRTIRRVLSRSPREKTKLLKKDVILELIQMMNDSNDLLTEQSVWILSEIVDSGNDARNFVLKYDLLSTVSRVIYHHNSKKHLMFALGGLFHDLCFINDSVIDLKYVSKIIKILSSIIHYRKDLKIYNESRAILFLVQSSQEHLDHVVHGGIIQKLLRLLGKDFASSINIFNICAVIADDSHEKIQFLLDLNLYKYLMPLFSSKDFRKQSSLYLLFSKIANGSHDQAMTLFSLNIIPQIINQLEKNFFGVKKEAFLVVSNVLRSCNQDKAQIFIDQNLFHFMSYLLELSDFSMHSIVLEFLVNLWKLYPNQKQEKNIREKMEKAGLIKYMEKLSKCENETLRNLSQSALKIFMAKKSFNSNEEMSILEHH